MHRTGQPRSAASHRSRTSRMHAPVHVHAGELTLTPIIGMQACASRASPDSHCWHAGMCQQQPSAQARMHE
eukprot:364886-Chlamydomonas_euryale.AAC.3